MTLFQPQPTGKLEVCQIELSSANRFVQQYHRHNRPTVGHIFSLGCFLDGKLVGVAICGRPVARRLAILGVLEVNRLCTDGTKNACSKLMGAVVKYARAKGFHKIISYTLMSEYGASLRASNFTLEAENVGKKAWTSQRSKSRPSGGIVGAQELKKRWAYQITKS